MNLPIVRLRLVGIVAVFFATAFARGPARSLAQQPVDPTVAELGQGFVSDTVRVNGTTLHYVRGGSGPAVVLLHGFPQNWYAYHHIMPRLARTFTVVSVDMRGIGQSSVILGGYAVNCVFDYSDAEGETSNQVIEAAVARAKGAAGEKSVGVLGAGIARQSLEADLLDESVAHLAPVLLGGGVHRCMSSDGRDSGAGRQR